MERGTERLQVFKGQIGQADRFVVEKAQQFLNVHAVTDAGVVRQPAFEAHVGLVGVEQTVEIGYAAQLGHMSIM